MRIGIKPFLCFSLFDRSQPDELGRSYVIAIASEAFPKCDWLIIISQLVVFMVALLLS